MNLEALLQSMEPEALERLAADKMSNANHVRLPPDLLREELCTVLKSCSYAQSVITARHPPAFALLSMVLDAPEHRVAIAGLKQQVLDATAEIARRVESGDLLSRDKQYALYRRILGDAWRSGLEIDSSEAALLAALRRELGISFVDHLLIEHHPDLRTFWQSEHAFERERNALLVAGLLFVDRDALVMPDEIAPLVRQAWDMPLSTEECKRLYDHLTGGDLSDALKAAGLKSSGTKEEKIAELLRHFISPREVLRALNLNDSLRVLAKRVNCTASGTKDELVDRLLEWFDRGADIRPVEAPAAPKEIPPDEPRALDEAGFRRLFGQLTNEELYEALSSQPDLRKSGTKEIRIQTLWESRFSESTLLTALPNRALALALERAGLKVSGPKDERITRLIEHHRTSRTDPAPPPNMEAVEEAPIVANAAAAVPDTITQRRDEIGRRMPFLDAEQVLLTSLVQDLGSLSDLELERLAARYDLQCFFLREEMRRLMATLSEHGLPVIERREAVDHDLYLYREVQ